MAQAPRLDFESYVAKRKGERSGGGIETTGHEYTYTFDRQSRVAFENTRPVAMAVEASVRLFKTVGTHQLLGSAVKVSERQFPRIYRSFGYEQLGPMQRDFSIVLEEHGLDLDRALQGVAVQPDYSMTEHARDLAGALRWNVIGALRRRNGQAAQTPVSSGPLSQ